MFKHISLAAVVVATSLICNVDEAEAFGGRGYARRQARRAYYTPAPVVVQRAYVAPVVNVYRPPVYYRAPVSVGVGRYGSSYRYGGYGWGYPAYRSGVSIGIGW